MLKYWHSISTLQFAISTQVNPSLGKLHRRGLFHLWRDTTQEIYSAIWRGGGLHLFSINWWRRQDFPVPALPITRNLNRKSESTRDGGMEINATPTSGWNPPGQSSDFLLILFCFCLHIILNWPSHHTVVCVLSAWPATNDPFTVLVCLKVL